LACAGITLGMITLGGYVRLNKAGLSMVKWDLTRLQSPKTDEEWNKEFAEYKEHPQYKKELTDLDLEGFKFIYLLEHYHRQLGKILGLSVIFPSLFFTITNIFNKKLVKRSFLISSLIGFQGVVGYWMVKSGLKENLGENPKMNEIRVSHYRLMIHFTLGITTFWILLNSGLFMLLKPQVLRANFEYLYSNNIIRRHLMITLHMIIFTAMFGSLLAGQNGGKIVNTFPKMGDVWFPTADHYDPKLNKITNNLENTFLVHFNHRVLATATLGTIIYQFVKVKSLGHINKWALRGFSLVTLLAIYQYILGILSVLNSVPPRLAHHHQFIGVMTITATIFSLNLTKRIRAADVKILLKKLIEKDSAGLDRYLSQYKLLHPKGYEKFIQKEYEQLK
jgi:cytochrome c oxidase assembly protein subunit 15